MNKTYLHILSIIILFGIVGCTNATSEQMTNLPSITPKPKELQLMRYTADSAKDVRQVILKDNLSPDSQNTSIVAEFEDKDLIKPFVEAIATAEKIVNISKRDTPRYAFDLNTDQNKNTFALYLDEVSIQAMIVDVTETSNGYRLTEEATHHLQKILFTDNNPSYGLEFTTEKNADGNLVAWPKQLDKDSYMLSSGPVVEMKGKLYHNILLGYGDSQAVNELLAFNPRNDEVSVKWSEGIGNSNNLWHNEFRRSHQTLYKLDEEHLLFLESDLTEDGGQYHLSTYNVVTDKVERLRENFWPLADDYDYIHKSEWNAERGQLVMQSYLGNVWFFDLRTGVDNVHLLKYRVIPHSTMGVASLFLSPTFDRFVHDDESGKITFYNAKGDTLRAIKLPEGQYVPSEKIKWNAAGTIAWMDTSIADNSRIKDIDIDYLRIAPQQITFYNPDGLLIGSVQAAGGSQGAVEVAGWIDSEVAVMKAYTVKIEDDGQYGLQESDITYFRYDVLKKKKSAKSKTMPLNTIPLAKDRMGVSTDDIEPLIEVNYNEITYNSRLF